MVRSRRTARLSAKNPKISVAVRSKFFVLLLLTLALIFDTVSRQPSSELLKNKSLPEMPAAK